MRQKEFWIDVTERAIKTFAQALVAVLVVGVPLWEIDWLNALGIALTATILSVLSSVASGQVGTDGTAAAVTTYSGRHRAGE